MFDGSATCAGQQAARATNRLKARENLQYRARSERAKRSSLRLRAEQVANGLDSSLLNLIGALGSNGDQRQRPLMVKVPRWTVLPLRLAVKSPLMVSRLLLLRVPVPTRSFT